jgi:uncharacterized protein YciI
MHYLIIYELAPDYLERRPAFRDEHLRLAWESVSRGELLLGGALGDPAEGAAILFEANSPAVAQQFAAADPYVRNGLVKSWRVHKWNTVVGTAASTPVKPPA